MYRDDACAVCGVALPPDHAYCREHAAQVDDRLHQIGALLERMLDDLPRLGSLLGEIAPQTWEWLSDLADDTSDWPPPLPLRLHLHADQVDVDVDVEPGRVRVDIEPDVQAWCEASASAMDVARLRTVARTCARAVGAGATY